MVTKAKPKLPDKKIAKKIAEGTGKANQRYVRNDNVANMEAKGWKKVGSWKQGERMSLGVRQDSPDMVLMEK